MLDTGRPKDFLRVYLFLEQGMVDMRRLQAVLKRHNLTKKWEEYQSRFEL